jgi:predicted DNA-binding transcriptional regulator YafY
MAVLTSVHRVIRILELLSMGRYLTSSELNREFDEKVSLRTIQRDMITIQQAGIPLICEKNYKKENVWSFPREYRRMILPSIQKSELISLYILKAYLKEFKGTKIEDNLSSVIDKLEDMAPGEVYLDLDNANDFVWDQDYGAYDYSKFDELIHQVINTIVEKKLIRITYKSRNENKAKTYQVFPYRLFSYHGSIYLAAYSPQYQNTISLAMQRIKSLSLAENIADPVPPFNMEIYRNNRFGVFSGPVETIQLQIDPRYALYFRNRTWHPSQQITEKNDGTLIIKFDAPVSPELITWILGWHTAIRVLKPESLIDEIKQKLKETLNIYDP